MNAAFPHANLVLAWLWVVLGFLSGAIMGCQFQREDWLGGYGSFKRRLYRLGHISFFGLAAINLMFYFTAHLFEPAGLGLIAAAWAFVVGAVSMPLCCVLTAHWPKTQWLFALPVSSLVGGGLFTLWEVIHL